MATNSPQDDTTPDRSSSPPNADLAAELKAVKAELAELRAQRREKRAAKLLGEEADADRSARDTQDKMVDAVETVLHHLKKDFFRDPPLAALGVAVVSGMATKALLARRHRIKPKVLGRDQPAARH